MAVCEFPLPKILFFTSGNFFTGSCKTMNYRITPIKGKAEANITAHFEVDVWLGEKCSELSEMVATAEFPLDTDGLTAVESWLSEQYNTLVEED